MPWPTEWNPVDRVAYRLIAAAPWWAQYDYRWDEVKATKAKELEKTLSSHEEKVFQSVPITDDWTISQICADLSRRRLGHDHPSVKRSVMSLIDRGMVIESSKNKYKRTPVKSVVAEADRPVDAIKPARLNMRLVKKVQPKQEPEFMKKLEDLSSRVGKLATEAKEIAEAFEEVAIEIVEHISTSEEKVKQLKQLQALLKSIGS
jgi:predicted DNA-binding protein